MKNQYFGDINDYLKYGLLRVIAGETGLRPAVCWMLTGDDGRRDGKKTSYQERVSAWRHYDPPLFDVLREAVQSGRRDIEVAESGQILPGAVYHSEVLSDDRESRRQYFVRLESCAAACDLVFFDPDNGMEVKSTRRGCRGSSKYLYWDEAKRFSALGKSLVVFQHFTRVKRGVFVGELRQRFGLETGADWIGVLATSNVAYFVVPAPGHEQALRNAFSKVCQQWNPLISDWLELASGGGLCSAPDSIVFSSRGRPA